MSKSTKAVEIMSSPELDPAAPTNEAAAEWVDLDSLTAWDKNPRKNDDAAKDVAKSIKRFGFAAPIVARKANREIIAGHTRAKAAQILGLKKVPVRFVDLDPAEAHLLALADNKLNEKAEWDDKLLGEVLSEFSLDDAALAGWDSKELDKMALTLLSGEVDETKDAEPQIERADELKAEWKTERGQLWRCGDHLILCGDSANPDDVKRVMGQDKACLVFTDPPYGVSIGKKNQMLNSVQPSGRVPADIVDDNLKPDELKGKLQPAFDNIVKLAMADDCTVFVCSPQGGDLMMMMMMMRDAGIPVRHNIIWDKMQPTFSMGRLDYDYQHEPILLTWGKRHKRPMLGNHKTSVWQIQKPRSSKEHPTMKPVELVVNALLNNSEAGDVVFDAYSGSGTTLLACEQTGRKARVIEIMPGYVAVALQRYKDATGNQPELVT
jgi:DNA modification methylase